MADVRKEMMKAVYPPPPWNRGKTKDDLITDILRVIDKHLWTMKKSRLLVADYDLEKAVLDSRH